MEHKGTIGRENENFFLALPYLTAGHAFNYRRWKRDARIQTQICRSLQYDLHMHQPEGKT